VKADDIQRDERMIDFMQQRLETVIREAFVVYLGDCRKKILAEDSRENLDSDLRKVAKLLRSRETTKAANRKGRNK
jgi:hypothetical protein